jgi:hypothetical protein
LEKTLDIKEAMHYSELVKEAKPFRETFPNASRLWNISHSLKNYVVYVKGARIVIGVDSTAKDDQDELEDDPESNKESDKGNEVEVEDNLERQNELKKTLKNQIGERYNS